MDSILEKLTLNMTMTGDLKSVYINSCSPIIAQRQRSIVWKLEQSHVE